MPGRTHRAQQAFDAKTGAGTRWRPQRQLVSQHADCDPLCLKSAHTHILSRVFRRAVLVFAVITSLVLLSMLPLLLLASLSASLILVPRHGNL